MDNFVGIPPPILLFPIRAFLVKNMWPVSDQFLRIGNIYNSDLIHETTQPNYLTTCCMCFSAQEDITTLASKMNELPSTQNGQAASQLIQPFPFERSVDAVCPPMDLDRPQTEYFMNGDAADVMTGPALNR